MELYGLDVIKERHWPHIIRDDFFDEIDFKWIRQLFDEYASQHPARNDEIRFVKKFRFFEDTIDPDKLMDKFPDRDDLVDRRSSIHAEGERIFKTVLPIAKSCLSKLYPEKLGLVEFSQFQLVECGANFQYRAHEDAIWKLLSIVIFVSPKENEGTIMLKTSDPNSVVGCVEWRQNRAFIFSRIPGVTWHRYCSDGQSPRRTVIFNLCTTQKGAIVELEAQRSIFSLFKLRLSTIRKNVFRAG